MATVERPRWRITVTSFVGHALVEPGTEVYFTPKDGGQVGANLTPLNDAAQEIIDAQTDDHPDKTANAVVREEAVELDDEERQELEQATTDGPVPVRLRKGSTKKPVAAPVEPVEPVEPVVTPKFEDLA